MKVISNEIDPVNLTPINKDHFILYSYAVNGDGSASRVEEKDIAQRIESKDLAWIHMDFEHPSTKKWIEEHLDYLNPTVVDALLAEETRPRVTRYDHGVMIILRGVNLNENEAPEDMVSLRLWVDEYRIISLRRRRLRAVVDIRESLEGGFGPQNSADFIARLTARLFERMEPTLSALDEKMDEIEETLLETLDSAYRKEITALRKQAIALRRYIAPQKDAMAQLRNMELDWLDQQSKYSIQESADRLLRYVEDLDALRERGQIIKEELAAGLSDQMNRNMYILSLVAAIFLPLGFLTGLLGINVGGMPGADEPLAFWIVCGVCVAFSILLAAIFRRLKWL